MFLSTLNLKEENTVTLPNELTPNHRLFLLAEDNPVDAELFSKMLDEAFKGQCSIVCVDRFEKISQALSKGNVEALILDMNLPDRSGADNVYHLDKTYPMLPIVVLTGNEDLDLAIHSLQNGAQDYLSKNNVTPEILKRSVRYAKERKQIELKLKDALEDAAFKNEQLAIQANYDSLTNIANRSYFNDIAKRTLARAKRKKSLVGLLYFDINNFKNINDTYGHLIGDGLLQQVANRLNKIVRSTDLLARLGGDEFVIITDLLEDKDDITPLLQRVQNQFESSFHIDSWDIDVSSSIGVAFYPEAENLDVLIKQADCAMYEAKSNSVEPVCVYSDKLAAQYARSQKIEFHLQGAIENQEIAAVFQPILDIHCPKNINLEVLSRWHSPVLGYVSPAEFIAIAEGTPLIEEITKNVIAQAGVIYNQVSNSKQSVACVFININAKQLSQPEFCSFILQHLEVNQLPPNKVCLELTGSHVIQDMNRSRQQFELLRSNDVRIALDNFGKGFASITHSFDLPFDILKLDHVLINAIDINERNQALVAGVIEMAHRLNIKVAAEGVEKKEEKETVIRLGCDLLQGYLVSKPVGMKEITAFCSSH
ncbi:GGDEF domain-containing response regulator [Marinomonas agarivorans]|nr:GGDEF domain-containing response regulator [Marinomonas agarivorans]